MEEQGGLGVKLRVEDLSFSYENGRGVFDGVTLGVDKGEVLSILGANGCGKTTLLKCINRVLTPKSGQVLVDGVNTSGLGRAQIAKKIGFLPQVHVSAYPYTVRDVAVMGRAPYLSITSSPGRADYKIADESLESLGITHLAEKPYTKISGGERQLALLAMVLTQQPEVLLLDEPTSHLDFGNQIKTLTMIKRLSGRGYTVVLTSHFPDHAFQLGCKVVIMKDGRIIDEGKADDVVTEENLRRVYGIDIKIVYSEEAGAKVCIPIVK
jgi:iron complex transport system ATP-binding protein